MPQELLVPLVTGALWGFFVKKNPYHSCRLLLPSAAQHFFLSVQSRGSYYL